MIYEINSTNYTGSLINNNTDSGSGIMGKDDFLKMLMAQMKYQDPMNPMESSDFSAQLAQFSSVEKLTNISDKMDELNSTNMVLSASINNTMAATVIGRHVKATGNQIYYNGEDDSAIHFKLGEAASEITIKIFDENGNLVQTINKNNMGSGEKEAAWDGNDKDGNRVNSGVYTFEVSATGSDGEDIIATPYICGEVTGVKYDQNG
ncbi:MAG: flagellar hook capping protein, partial [Calditrichia bacterium]|nr:flagellar hook capping protein [Calditrichia bacterium]